MTIPTTEFPVVVGWTSPLDFDLLDDEATPATTMAGMTVEFICKNRDGDQIPFTGDVSIADATAWTVRLSPDSTDFSVAGVYRCRFKVTDSNGKIAYFPQDQWLIMNVRDEA